jgi:type I restriction enzyme S subunit
MATIGDLAEYVNRGRAPSYVDESAMPVINQRCIRWHGIEFDYVKYTDDSKAKNLAEEQFLKSGDVLWNSTGTGTIGRATVFRPTARFSRWVVDTHVTIVRSTHYVPELLYYWIASAEIQNQIGEMQLGSTNQVELSRERVLNTLVPVPPRSEQERIVAKIDELFSELDAGVASLKRARALLKKYRQAVLKAAVTGEPDPRLARAPSRMLRSRHPSSNLRISAQGSNILRSCNSKAEISQSERPLECTRQLDVVLH